MVRPNSNRHQPDDDDYDDVDVTQIIAGSFSFLIIILMCLAVAYLSERRKRRVAREFEEDRARQHENAIRRHIRRKREAEETVLTVVIDSDESNVTSSSFDSEESENASASPNPSPNAPSLSNRNIVAELSSVIGTECSICFQAFEEGSLITLSHNLKCTHYFHKQCLVDWLARDDRCPTCRRAYLKNDDDENHEHHENHENEEENNDPDEENQGNVTDPNSGESIDVEESSSTQVPEVLPPQGQGRDSRSSTNPVPSIGNNDNGFNEEAIGVDDLGLVDETVEVEETNHLTAQFPISNPTRSGDSNPFDEEAPRLPRIDRNRNGHRNSRYIPVRTNEQSSIMA